MGYKKRGVTMKARKLLHAKKAGVIGIPRIFDRIPTECDRV
jgi:hypothetical protein